MLESKLEKIRSGCGIANEVYAPNTEYPPEIRQASLASLQDEDPWRRIGFAGGIAKNVFLHPIRTYRILKD